MRGTRLHFWPMEHPLSKALVLLAVGILPAISFAQEEPQQKSFYRVEVIVFTHAGGETDAWPLERPADHAGTFDPAWQSFASRQQLDRTEDEGGARRSDREAALSVVETIANLESGEESFSEALLYPEPWRALEALSEPMQQARRRLEQSGAYRIHAWLAWHQPVDEESGGRAVRIHDDQLIDVDWVSLSATGRLLRDGRPVETIEELAPAFHYRLDGFIRLRQRQFMHADVTLDWRVPAAIGPTPFPVPTRNAELEVHRLDQSRTIRPDRFEYFDSQWTGLLLRLTPYELDPPEEESEAPDGEAESP